MSRYHSESDFERNLAIQRNLTPQTVAVLRKHNVTEQAELRLEFFFYTDHESKATQLESALRQLGYDVESAFNDDIFVVTGWTTPIKMDESTVVQWTDDMCRIGFSQDCEFDGWGTNPNQ